MFTLQMKHSREVLFKTFQHCDSPPSLYFSEIEGVTTNDSQLPVGAGSVPVTQRREFSLLVIRIWLHLNLFFLVLKILTSIFFFFNSFYSSLLSYS